MQSHQNPDLKCGDSQVGGISKIWGLSLRLYIRCPNPGDLYHNDEPLKHLALKTSRANTQDTQRAVGNGNSAFKGLAHRLSHPGIQYESSSLKCV